MPVIFVCSRDYILPFVTPQFSPSSTIRIYKLPGISKVRYYRKRMHPPFRNHIIFRRWDKEYHRLMVVKISQYVSKTWFVTAIVNANAATFLDSYQ
jgi:hypothetical protein